MIYNDKLPQVSLLLMLVMTYHLVQHSFDQNQNIC